MTPMIEHVRLRGGSYSHVPEVAEMCPECIRAERDRLRAALERHHQPYSPLTRPCDICGLDPTSEGPWPGTKWAQPKADPTEAPDEAAMLAEGGRDPSWGTTP